MNAFEDILGKLNNPQNSLTVEDRKKIKQTTGNIENNIKTSLVNLLMGQFSKVAVYDTAIGSVIEKLSQRAQHMDTEELIAFLSVLTKVNASETKNVLDLFKKNDTDVKQFIQEIQKISKTSAVLQEEEDMKDSVKISLTPEKKERILQLMDKMTEKEKKEDIVIKKDNVEEETIIKNNE